MVYEEAHSYLPKNEKSSFIFGYARKAVEISNRNNELILDTLAEAYYVNNNSEKAIRVNREAYDLSRNNDMRNMLDSHLTKYKFFQGR